MTAPVLDPMTSPLPTEEHYARNLIGGHWRFPAAPYDFEVRNPADSTICAVVPLSSRFDVAAAYRAASVVETGVWSGAAGRMAMLHAIVERLAGAADELAELQALETGLTLADSRAVVSATLDVARTLLSCSTGVTAQGERRAADVSGHILSWGAPFTEMVTSVLPALVRGDSVIVKPSLRGPLTPVAVALLAADTGLPDGVLNVVQGTGGDIGADLIGRRELSTLYVRGGERTIAQAQRAHDRTGVPLRVLRGGGNVCVIGPDLDVDSDGDIEILADAITSAVRVHSAGGPFGLPLLAVHTAQAEALLHAVLTRLAETIAAPLPTELLRRRAVQRIEGLRAAGATILLGGNEIPDDVAHRMAWRLPPTVLLLGGPDSMAVRREQASVPLGPVLSVLTWDHPDQLANVFTALRNRDGTASLCGANGAVTHLPHPRAVVGHDAPRPLFATLAPAWTGGA